MVAFLEVEFLGTGTSTGVPVIGCSCPVCTSLDPRNARLRSSVIVRSETTTLLIDTSPDLRQQVLRSDLRVIDAVLYSHIHLDHVAGFDDLRAFCWRREGKLPLYAGKQTMESLQSMFAWAFSPHNNYVGYVRPAPYVVKDVFRIGDIDITPVPVIHGDVEMLGYIFQVRKEEGVCRVGYIVDVKTIPASSLLLLDNLDLLIMDCLRKREHPTHQSMGEALAVVERLFPKQTLLTHISHDIEYVAESKELPVNIQLAYDGLVVRIN